jgi:hypothetical protein
VTTEYTYYLSWVHQQPRGFVFETATLTYTYEVNTLEAIQTVQTALRADGYTGAIVLGFSLLNTRTPG